MLTRTNTSGITEHFSCELYCLPVVHTLRLRSWNEPVLWMMISRRIREILCSSENLLTHYRYACVIYILCHSCEQSSAIGPRATSMSLLLAEVRVDSADFSFCPEPARTISGSFPQWPWSANVHYFCHIDFWAFTQFSCFITSIHPNQRPHGMLVSTSVRNFLQTADCT